MALSMPNMDDNRQGARYNEVLASGQSNVVAGSVYINIQNVNVTHGRSFNLQQFLGGDLGASQDPNPLSQENNLSDSTNVDSPSQSSDSTNPEYSYRQMIAYGPATATSTRPSCTILRRPSPTEQRYKYFLSSEGLASYVVLRQVRHMAGPNAEVRRIQNGSWDGYLIYGKLLGDEQISELMQRSRQYIREQRIDRHVMSHD